MTVSYEVDRGSSQVKNRPLNPPVPVEYFPQSHDLEAMTHDFGTFGPGKVSQSSLRASESGCCGADLLSGTYQLV